MQEDGASALSKAKDATSNTQLRNKSTERTASRGMGSGMRRIQQNQSNGNIMHATS